MTIRFSLGKWLTSYNKTWHEKSGAKWKKKLVALIIPKAIVKVKVVLKIHLKDEN